MDFTRVLSLLIVFGAFSASNASGQGRGFIGVTDSENSGQVIVDEATSDTLKSSLTTVFLPIIYIIVFVVGLPANAMAVWVFLIRTQKKHPSSIYMGNLALADLLFVIWTP
ncbi:hypothetical protein Q5P01_024230 [Channa striata]|uniref:G-protein coupled receptors family 1 profile domain-containing protein n=1 Tax=Channa striata TaxID=64152 RepID=A0AA88IZJ1_CHASR|nr:hypothetical protein Q5P01_024230 [Channa striata]